MECEALEVEVELEVDVVVHDDGTLCLRYLVLEVMEVRNLLLLDRINLDR